MLDSVTAFSFNGSNTLTIGAGGITTAPVTSTNKSFVFNNALRLSADQTWNIGTRNGTSGSNSFILSATSGLDTDGYSLTLRGRGTKEFRADITGGGDIIVGPAEPGSSTTTRFVNARASDSNITVTAANQADTSNAIVNFIVQGNIGSAARMNGLTLQGQGSSSGVAFFVDQNNTTSDTLDIITNALTIEQGFAAVQVRARNTQNAQLLADSLDRRAGSVVLFAGNNFGTNDAGTGTNSTNTVFSSAPALVGGGGSAGQPTIGIIKGAFGDIAYSGGQTGASATSGLVTYDAAKGVRVLSADEYRDYIADGQMSLDNVRLSNNSGEGPAITAIFQDTTINSLSFNVSGANTADGSGIFIDGTGTLKINSGMIYASQLVTGQPSSGNTNNKMHIAVPTLDLAGQEGVIIATTSGIRTSGSREGGYLEISSVITNDGGNGITIAGGGTVKFSGTNDNTYTGPTTVNTGYLYLAAGGTSDLIPGDLVINGGAVEDGGNRIADTSNIIINGGSFKLQLGNEGSSRSETFHSLIMTGGKYQSGSSGHSGSSTLTGSATLFGGNINLVPQTNMSVAGLTTLSGGVVNISNASSASSHNTYLALNGGLAIENTAEGAYTPIIIGGHSSNRGGKLLLNGDVTFTGNTINGNTVTIDAVASTNMGVIDLNGETRTFTIGDGAADVDLAIVPAIENGGIVKAGAGTLALDGVNTYSGPTTITGGTLKLGSAGSISSSSTIQIGVGAILDTTAQAFAMGGGQTIVFDIDPTDDGSAGLLLAGDLDITSGSIDFNLLGTLDDAVYVLATYSGTLTGSEFASVSNLPAGYNIDYAYNGNSIALTVPEPTAVGTAGAVALFGLLRRQRRKA